MELLNGENARQGDLERQGAGGYQDQSIGRSHDAQSDSKQEPRSYAAKIFETENRHILAILLALGLLIAACASSDPPNPADGAADNQEGVVQLDAQLPTGEQLQASVQIPESLERTHEALDYLVYLPDGYGDDPEREWSMILFLHGAGNETNDPSFILTVGLPAVILADEQPDNFPFIVISPQGFPGETWWSAGMVSALATLLDEVAQIYRVDTDRVYLTGMGMGGHGAWWLATAYPERFAAMSSISGSGYRSAVDTQPALVCRLEDLPIWAIHGAQDEISLPESSHLEVEALEEHCSADVRWTLYEDEGHLGTSIRAYHDPALYEWMLEHSR